MNKGKWFLSEKVTSLNLFGTPRTGKFNELDDDYSIGHLATRSRVGCSNRRWLVTSYFSALPPKEFYDTRAALHY